MDVGHGLDSSEATIHRPPILSTHSDPVPKTPPCLPPNRPGSAPPAVAGAFYPADATVLTTTVDALFDACRDRPVQAGAQALIAPHAGYVYSGRQAAAGYASLPEPGTAPRRVILVGPAHRLAFRGIAVPTVAAFATPLGEVPVDVPLREAALTFSEVIRNDAAHAAEHALEVQLPFLQRRLNPGQALTCLPLVIGHADAATVAEVLDALWTPSTLLVISSDLSHYLAEPAAHARDAATCRRILAAQADLTAPDACGATPINALLILSQRRGLALRQIDYGTSAAAPGLGDPRRVVGYGAFVAVPA